jgi:hypothetical protein
MTLFQLIKKHPNLAKRRIVLFELDGPYVNKNGEQVLSVRLEKLELEK